MAKKSNGRSDWCKHYRAMASNDTCNAGVAFKSLDLQKIGSANCPCWERRPDLCQLAVYRTPEEMAAEEAEFEKRFASTMIARVAIVEHLGGPWKRGMSGTSGVIDCPACNSQKSLYFSRSGYNGHVHAKCDTKGCVSWME